MRARLALDVSRQRCELREVVLRDKPQEMLRASSKGTVPVLVDIDGTVIDESLDIMLWTLRRNDPEGWLSPPESLLEMLSLIAHFDGHFKRHLDRYKYPSRFADANREASRSEASEDIRSLDARLALRSYLFGDRPALADMAIAPFVRQFAHVDATWFGGEPWPGVQRWLDEMTASERFRRIMRALPAWVPGTPGVEFPFREDKSRDTS